MKAQTVFLTMLLFLIIPVSAYAYIDPGTGSMMIQALIAAFAALSVSLGIFRKKLSLFFNRFFGKKQTQEKSDVESEKGEDAGGN